MAPVLDGQAVNAANTNPAFLDAQQDDTALGKITLANTETASGASVTNAQQEHNSAASFMGKALNAAKDALPSWTNTDVGTSGDTLKARAEALTAEFNHVSGHKHTGAAGEAPKIEAQDLASVRLKGSFVQATDLSAVSGSSVVVTTELAGRTASTGDTVKGVVVLTPNNRVIVRHPTSQDAFEDGAGNQVYGRLTEASGVWTLSFYVDLAGVETAYSFSSSTGIRWYFQQLYNPITDAPIYSDLASIPSDNATQDIVDATASQRGLVSTGTQSFGGAKTFTGDVNVDGETRLKSSLGGVLKALAGAVSAGLVNLANEVTSVLGLSNGGTGADLSATGGSGQYVKQSSAGAALSVGTIAAADYPTMVGANGTTAGTKGAVPQPAASDNVKFLRGDGLWANAGGGGGGGGSLVWIEDDNAPLVQVEYGMQVYVFGAEQGQQLTALIKVPSSYTAGSQIFLRTHAYSAETANTVVIRANTALVKPGTTDVTAIPAGDQSSASIALSSSTSNKLQAATLALTNVSGQVGGVSVAAGDYLFVTFLRGASLHGDTGTQDVKVPIESAEVTFQ